MAEEKAEEQHSYSQRSSLDEFILLRHGTIKAPGQSGSMDHIRLLRIGLLNMNSENPASWGWHVST